MNTSFATSTVRKYKSRSIRGEMIAFFRGPTGRLKIHEHRGIVRENSNCGKVTSNGVNYLLIQKGWHRIFEIIFKEIPKNILHAGKHPIL